MDTLKKVDDILLEVGSRMAKKGEYHPDWVELVFSKMRRDEKLKEVSFFEFVYGGCVSEEEHKVLSAATQEFLKLGFWQED